LGGGKVGRDKETFRGEGGTLVSPRGGEGEEIFEGKETVKRGLPKVKKKKKKKKKNQKKTKKKKRRAFELMLKSVHVTVANKKKRKKKRKKGRALLWSALWLVVYACGGERGGARRYFNASEGKYHQK